MSGVFDLGELVKRTIKYLVEGVMVAIAAYAILNAVCRLTKWPSSLSLLLPPSVSLIPMSPVWPLALEQVLDSVSAPTSSDSPHLFGSK